MSPLGTTHAQHWMRMALEEATAAAERNEVPVGAVLIAGNTGALIARAGNTTQATHDPTGHAEINVLRHGAALYKTPRLEQCDLYVTLEPCAMCAGAIALARIRRLYFAAWDKKGGGVDHGAKVFDHPTCYHVPEVIGGILEHEATRLLQEFFRTRR